MSKHTPGPWHVIIDDTGGPFSGWPSVVASDEIDAAVVHRAGFKQEFWGDWSMREAVANARLIASAPDLLAALQTAHQFITNGIELGYIRLPSPGTPDPALKTPEIVRAAIAKATGETS